MKDIKVVIREPKEKCSHEEAVYMRALYVYKLWQIKQEIER